MVSSRAAFSGKIARVRVDNVVMPGGTIAAREVVEHDRAVAVAAVDEAGRIILIEQYRHPLRRRLWELPAGLMDLHGEAPQLAAAREFLEETGYRAEHWEVLADIASSPGFTDEAVRIYLARDLHLAERPPGTDDEEADLRVVAVPLDLALAAVLDGRIVNGAAVTGVLGAVTVLRDGYPLRPGDDPWTGGPAVTRVDGEPLDAPTIDVPATDPTVTDNTATDNTARTTRPRAAAP